MPNTGSTAPARCQFIGHRYPLSYELLHDSNQRRLYQHTCVRCDERGPALPAESIIDWRHAHGLSWAPTSYPRLQALRLSVSYSARTLLHHALSRVGCSDGHPHLQPVSDQDDSAGYERPRA